MASDELAREDVDDASTGKPDKPDKPGSRPKRGGLARYWPVAAVVVVVAAALGVGALVGGGDEEEGDSGTAAPASGTAPALAAFPDEDPLEAPDCDPETGLLAIPSIYAPECVPLWPEGRDNGGATAPGVTADEIVVALYVAEVSAETEDAISELEGEDAPTEEEEAEYRQQVVEAYSALYETYGREVTVVEVQASGEGNDEAAARSDAIRIADEIGAFAVIGGPGQTNVFAETLADREVLCLCLASQPQEVYEEMAPYAWGALMASTQGYVHRADFVAGLAGEPAEFAGDEAFQETERSFGLVYYETADGAYGPGVDFFEEQLAEDGIELAARIPYVLDMSRTAEDAATIIARLKDEGVTSVIFAGDPFFPASLTAAATEQDYWPEWLLTGSTGTDTATAARQYDQEQWANAFGISYLLARLDPTYAEEVAVDQNLVAWYLGEPLEAYPNIFDFGRLFLGIHLAGPELTAETYRDGMFAWGGLDGHVTAFGASYGTELWPWPDYAGADDVTLVWWDPEAEGEAENGDEGTGLYRYVDGGSRFLPGDLDASSVSFFDEAGTSLFLDETPEQDLPPEYPRRTSREG